MNDQKCFNSTLVRLEEADTGEGTWVTIKFQFHPGPIRSLIVNRRVAQSERFQFHPGPIRRRRRAGSGRKSRSCFNSTLVRLEAAREVPGLTSFPGFNSTLVRLEG